MPRGRGRGRSERDAARGRRRGYQAFWQGRGIALREIHVAGCDPGHARAATHALLTGRGSRPDALICENDIFAFGAIEAIRGGLGRRIPEDIGLAGFSAFDLTTIRQPVEDMVALLVEMIAGRAPAASAQLPGRLITRGTT